MLHESPLQQLPSFPAADLLPLQHEPSFPSFMGHESPVQQQDGMAQHDSFLSPVFGVTFCANAAEERVSARPSIRAVANFLMLVIPVSFFEKIFARASVDTLIPQTTDKNVCPTRGAGRSLDQENTTAQVGMSAVIEKSGGRGNSQLPNTDQRQGGRLKCYESCRFIRTRL